MTRDYDLVPDGFIERDALAPTMDVPPAKRTKGPEPQPAEHRCACGDIVLTGQTTEGKTITLSVHHAMPTYTMVWLNGQTRPRFAQSSAYSVHPCRTHPPFIEEAP